MTQPIPPDFVAPEIPVVETADRGIGGDPAAPAIPAAAPGTGTLVAHTPATPAIAAR